MTFYRMQLSDGQMNIDKRTNQTVLIFSNQNKITMLKTSDNNLSIFSTFTII